MISSAHHIPVSSGWGVPVAREKNGVPMNRLLLTFLTGHSIPAIWYKLMLSTRSPILQYRGMDSGMFENHKRQKMANQKKLFIYFFKYTFFYLEDFTFRAAPGI